MSSFLVKVFFTFMVDLESNSLGEEKYLKINIIMQLQERAMFLGQTGRI